MPSYRVKEKISNTSLACAAAAVPGAFVPGIDIAAVGGLWTSMMLTIAGEHGISFDDSPEAFIGSIAAGIGAYWTGSRIITKGLSIAIGFLTAGIGFAIAAVASNVALNAYFSWSLGRKMDEIFAAHGGARAGQEIAVLIIKAVCHIPKWGELSEFIDDTGLSVSKLSDIIENN